MATLYTCRAIVVIPAASKEAANAWVKDNIDPVGGENTFTVPLTDPDDPETIVSYWCSIACTQDQYQLIKGHFGSDCYDGNQTASETVLQTENLETQSLV